MDDLNNIEMAETDAINFMQGFYSQAKSEITSMEYEYFRDLENAGITDWGCPWNWLNTRHIFEGGYEPKFGETWEQAGRRWYIEHRAAISHDFVPRFADRNTDDHSADNTAAKDEFEPGCVYHSCSDNSNFYEFRDGDLSVFCYVPGNGMSTKNGSIWIFGADLGDTSYTADIEVPCGEFDFIRYDEDEPQTDWQAMRRAVIAAARKVIWGAA